MKRASYICDQCGGSVPVKWRDSGALKMEIGYTNGGKRAVFTCSSCRAKNVAAHEAAKPAAMSVHSDGAPQEIGS